MNDADNAVVSETLAIAELATSQIALDITLLSQRTQRDIEGVMAKMLGPRVGRLDTLLPKGPPSPDVSPKAGRPPEGPKTEAKAGR